LSIESEGLAGSVNMATDWALLRQAQGGSAFLRMYRWSPPCLSFGRNEPATSRYDLEQVRALGLDTVRRPTGGRAVWHDQELTYAVAAPSDLFGSLQEAYISIHRVLADGLRTLGAAVELAERHRGPLVGPGGGACFASPVGGEIVAGGRKLVGSAQVREGDAFLQHGSVLLGDGQDVVTRVTRGPGVASAATSLRAVLDRAVTFDELAQAIADVAREQWEGSWIAADVTCSAEDIARFENSDWTLRR
jgi:lipoate-protein ligase A